MCRTLRTARSMCGAKDGAAFAVRVLVAWRVTALEYGCVAGAAGNLLRTVSASLVGTPGLASKSRGATQ